MTGEPIFCIADERRVLGRTLGRAAGLIAGDDQTPVNGERIHGTRTGGERAIVSKCTEKPHKKIQNLKSIIITEIELYYLKFKNETCSFIKRWPSKYDLNAWHVILKKQGHQNPHIHPNGWLSGVIYLKVVPSFKKNEGAIEFSLNGEQYYDAKSPKVVHLPKAGDIILFPSSLHHRTIPFSADTDRISIAFDLVPN